MSTVGISPSRFERRVDILTGQMPTGATSASYTPRLLATPNRKNIDSIWNQHYKRFGADALTKQG